MTPQILTAAQIEDFIQRGWVKCEAAFPRAQAALAQDFLWDKLAERGIRKDDPSTWHSPMEFIAENYNTPPFDGCATPRLAAACADLVGDGRWVAQHEIGWWGWWPVNFAVGSDQPWDVPADEWHIDTPDHGTRADAPDQGLLMICLFSEIGPRGGGTLLLEGSHRLASRFLHESPGLTQNETNRRLKEGHPYLRALCGIDDGEGLPGTDTSNARGVNAALLERSAASDKTARIRRFMDEVTVDDDGIELRVVEVTGSPGDVVLGHPFLLHSPSFNHSGRPRFMCNRKTPLAAPLQFDRADGDYSPLEESVRRAIGVTVTA